MKKNLLHLILSSLVLVLLSGIFSTAFAQQQRGSISGTIVTNDNKPADDVIIKITSNSKTAITNEQGYFQMKNLVPATYEIKISLVGFETIYQQVTVEAGKDVTADVQLKVSQKELQEVSVSSSRNKIASKTTDQVARMPISNLQNPQVYNIVGKEVIKQQNIVVLTDAFRNAPGVTPVLYPSGGIAALSRGFSTDVNARNGVQSTVGRSSADVANVERIEFMKGPSGTLFGASISSFGGVVNLVTKKPFETFQGSVDLSVGSFALGRVAVDVNAPLNKDKSLLLRVNSAIQRQDSYNDRGFYNSSLFAPSLTYKVDERFTLLFDAEVYSVNSIRPSYVSISPTSGIHSYADIPLNYNTSLYDNDLDAKTDAVKFFGEGKYKLSDNWTSSTNIAYVNEHTERSYQDYPTWVSKDSVGIEVSRYGPISNTYSSLQQNFNGKFTTGGLKHTMVIGANFTQYIGRGISGSAILDSIDLRTGYQKVNRQAVEKALAASDLMNWGISNTTTYGVYASDVVNISDRLYAMLSLRYEYIKDKSTGPWATQYSQGSLSPKLGLVYQLIKDKVSIFGNYMNGYQNYPPIQQPNGTTLTVKPIYAIQYEGGIKAELLDKKITTSLSYYNIDIDNALRYDTKFFAFQDGKQVSKGLEWDFTANPLDGLSVILGYGYNDNRIINATGLEGNHASNAPQHIANYWVNYQFKTGALKNFGLGAGGNYVGKAYADDTNLFLLPSYHIVNATAFYENTKIRIGLKLNNLTDQKSWGFWGAPNPTRNFITNFILKF